MELAYAANRPGTGVGLKHELGVDRARRTGAGDDQLVEPGLPPEERHVVTKTARRRIKVAGTTSLVVLRCKGRARG